MADFVLVHSPVTGPSTWQRVAADLTERGHRVALPATPPAATSLGWAAFVGSVASLACGLRSPVLVGHSGAGPLLPQIGARLQASAMVFVDSDVPPESGEAPLVPPDFLEFLRELATGGRLPPWSEWFGPAAMAELIPDEDLRAFVLADMPALPIAFFEERVPVPAGGPPDRPSPRHRDAARGRHRGDRIRLCLIKPSRSAGGRAQRPPR
jgi:hypothetical protein